MDYYIHILVLAILYTMLSQSLLLISGYSGLISLAHAGFYGIGAYTSAILSINFGLTFLDLRKATLAAVSLLVFSAIFLPSIIFI